MNYSIILIKIFKLNKRKEKKIERKEKKKNRKKNKKKPYKMKNSFISDKGQIFMNRVFLYN